MVAFVLLARLTGVLVHLKGPFGAGLADLSRLVVHDGDGGLFLAADVAWSFDDSVVQFIRLFARRRQRRSPHSAFE